MKLVHTRDYLFLIDTEEPIRKGDYFTVELFLSGDNFLKYEDGDEVDPNTLKEYGYYKIVAYYPLVDDAKQFHLPLLPNPFIDDQDLALKYADEIDTNIDDYSRGRWYGRLEGYNAAQEDLSEKKYTLEDIRDSIAEGYNKGRYIESKNIQPEDDIFEDFIKSLTEPKLPTEFIPQIEEHCGCSCHHPGKIIRHIVACCHPGSFVLNFDNGKRELIGTYKY